jgi:hypothetical protein
VTDETVAEGIADGPACYANYRAVGQSVRGVVEVVLYSDAYFIGEVTHGAGPVVLLNPIGFDAGRIGPAIILRLTIYSGFGPDLKGPLKGNLSRFTGATPWDEIACLLSLVHGARLVAGGVVREFDSPGSFGTPYVDREPPKIYLSSRLAGPMLPWVAEKKEITAGLLPSIGSLRPEEALALVRSARSYRDALWVADADPQLAWLLFVSALEVIATRVAARNDDDVEARLRTAAPEIAVALDEIGAGAAAKMAPLLAPLVKSTARFLRLFEVFPPVPPERRPPEGFQFRPWDTAMVKALKAVYGWRSQALHMGIPFPPPMCQPPHFQGRDWQAPCETVPGLGAHIQLGSWTRDQMPFGLHLFEHITRTTIVRWWASVSAPAGGSESSAPVP